MSDTTWLLATPFGRFLSVDPILGNLLQPQSWNRYAYVLNNPINRIDPSGMKMECVTKDDGSEECTIIPDPPPPPAPKPEPKLSESMAEWLKERWNSMQHEAGNLEYLRWRDAPILRPKRDVPCKSYGERFLQSFAETNGLPGLTAPTGLGIMTAGKTAQVTGGVFSGQVFVVRRLVGAF